MTKVVATRKGGQPGWIAALPKKLTVLGQRGEWVADAWEYHMESLDIRSKTPAGHYSAKDARALGRQALSPPMVQDYSHSTGEGRAGASKQVLAHLHKLKE